MSKIMNVVPQVAHLRDLSPQDLRDKVGGCGREQGGESGCGRGESIAP